MNFSEGTAGTIVVPEEDFKIFTLFITWMYTLGRVTSSQFGTVSCAY